MAPTRTGKIAAFALAILMVAPVSAAPPALAESDAPPLTLRPLALINASQFAAARYLVVTTLTYSAAMQSIADWKTQKGLPARVALLEDITTSYAGRDDAEKIHNFLQDVYFNATGSQLKYVLLGGGAGLIPIRYLRTGGSVVTSYTHDDVFSDVYYAGLNSDWDGNGNNVFGEYGEEDWDANVYVGRLPFGSPSEAAFARDNLLSYEKTPFVGAWMASAAAFASVMDPPNKLVPPNDYAWWEDNAIRSVWNTQPYLPPTMTLDLLADYYELDPGNYTPAQDRLSNASMVGSINAGKSVVISVTHGWVPSGRGVPEYRGFDGVVYSWGDGLTYLNASSFTNFGQLSFGYFSSCLIGNFSNTALPNFGRFVVQDNHGFVAEIVPTDGTLRGEDDFNSLGIREGNWWQSENFWKNFFTGTDPFRPGPALYQGIRDYAVHVVDEGRDETWGGYRTQKAVYNLLGDPEVPIWTDVAASFNATLPTQVYTAESHFRATLTDTLGRPAAGATVALTGAGVYAVGTTDALGRVDMVVAPTSTGSLWVTATLHNFLPFQATVPVVTAPPDLSIGPANVSLPAPVLRAGELVQVNFTVRNVGQLAAGPTDARALVTPPGGLPQIVAPSLPLGALSPGQSVQASFNWTPVEDGLSELRIVVDPGDAVAEFDELNNEVTLPVEVSSVDLFLDAASIGLNPPGQVVPGGSLTAEGPIGRVGLVPRPYLVGYELLRADGSVVSSGNTVASNTQGAFTLAVQAPEAGTFTLRISADSGGDVSEFDESNNAAEFAVSAGAGPTIYALPAVLVDENAAPAAAIPDLRGFVADPDTPFSQLTIAAQASAPELSVWVDGFALYAHPRPHWSGTGTVTLDVSDGRESARTSTSFTVHPADAPPQVDHPPAQFAVVGEPFVFQIQASDPDGGTLSFASSASGPPAMPALPVDGNGRIAFVPAEGLVGSWAFTITVRDGSGQTTGVPFLLSVLPSNRAPELADMGRLEITRGAAASFTLIAVDPDGDPVTFTADTARATLSAAGALRLTAEQVAALPDGDAVIAVTVSDGRAESHGFVTLTVVPAAAGPAEPYGTELAPLATTLAALAAVAAGLVFTAARFRRRN